MNERRDLVRRGTAGQAFLDDPSALHDQETVGEGPGEIENGSVRIAREKVNLGELLSQIIDMHRIQAEGRINWTTPEAGEHLEQIFVKIGVENRASAAAAATRVILAN